MSTMTSRTAPRTHLTYLAWLGGTSAKWMPRRVPRLDTEQLACARVRSWPVASRNSAPRNHSWKLPRSSGKTLGSSTQAPSIPSGRTYCSLPRVVRLLLLLLQRPAQLARRPTQDRLRGGTGGGLAPSGALGRQLGGSGRERLDHGIPGRRDVERHGEGHRLAAPAGQHGQRQTP